MCLRKFIRANLLTMGGLYDGDGLYQTSIADNKNSSATVRGNAHLGPSKHFAAGRHFGFAGSRSRWRECQGHTN